MGRITWDLDPENYAIVTELYNRATSPKRGVRFVSGSQKKIADEIAADPRSIPQLASDTLLALLQAGADADTTRMLGTGAATVRILITASTLNTGTGMARIEGSPDPITAATAARLTCDGTTTQITLDGFGSPLDVGDTQRLFTPKQRIALAIRDGACMFGTCQSPPSLTEAHHIIPWSEGGTTDLANGILLCKFHHLLLHNNNWHIKRIGTKFFLIPPPDIDPDRQPQPMPSKSAAIRDLRRELDPVSA